MFVRLFHFCPTFFYFLLFLYFIIFIYFLQQLLVQLLPLQSLTNPRKVETKTLNEEFRSKLTFFVFQTNGHFKLKGEGSYIAYKLKLLKKLLRKKFAFGFRNNQRWRLTLHTYFFLCSFLCFGKLKF